MRQPVTSPEDTIPPIDYSAWVATLRRNSQRAKNALTVIPQDELRKMSPKAQAAVMVACGYLED